MRIKKNEIIDKDNLLNESGIRIPKGTYAAKVIFHADLDGVMSAILTVNQLEKQGIPKSKIKLSSIQYGDNKEEVKKKLSASKGQMVALVDFARLPDEGVRTPDFWSDHHQQSEAEKKQEEKKFVETRKKEGKPFKLPPSEKRDMASKGKEQGFTKELFDKYTQKSFEKAKEKGGWGTLSIDIGSVIDNWKNTDIKYVMSKVEDAKIDLTGKEKILDFIRKRMKEEK